MTRLQTASFGPFVKGVVDTTNPSLGLAGSLATAKGVVLSGAGQFETREGTRTVLTLKDDQGTPADIDAVLAITPFADGAIAIGWSESQEDVYLYRLTSTLDDWYDGTGALQGTASPEPIGVLWSSVTTAPDVLLAEGLGVLYIAHTEPVVGSTLTYQTRTFTPDATLADLQSDLDSDSTPEDLFFAGVISFQQHLWGWGFGSGTTSGTGYRPEMARFSGPIFTSGSAGLFSPSDSITLGDRVRSQREAIVGAGVAGDALFLGAPHALTRVTGFGRSSWHRVQLDKSFGFVGPKCMVTVGQVLYYWSSRGPMRVGMGAPEPLWDRIVGTVQAAINPSKIVAGYDEATDQVCWAYDAGDGVRARLTYDVRRDVFLGPDDDWGLELRCMGSVSPVYTSTATVVYGPSGAPTGASTTSVGATTATANWTAGDATAQSQVEYRVQGTSSWTVATSSVPAGQTSYTISGLSSSVAYEWRVAHHKAGTFSAYLGPAVATQFTTVGTLNPPTNLAGDGSTLETIHLTWTNSGESGVSTEVWAAGPDDGGSHSLRATVGVGVSSYDLATGETTFGTGDSWDVKVRHVKSGFTASTFTAVVTVNLP